MVRQIRHRPSLALCQTNGTVDLALSAPDLFAPLSHDIADAVAFDVHRLQRLPSLGVNDVAETQTHWLDQDDIESTLHRLLHPNSVLPRTSKSPPVRGPSRASHALGFPSGVDATWKAPASSCPVPNRAINNRDVLNKALRRSREHVSELLILHGFNVPLVFDAPTAERTARVSSRRLARAVESASFDTGIPVLRTGDGLAGRFALSNLSVPPLARPALAFPALAGSSESPFECTNKSVQNTVSRNGGPDIRLAFRVRPADNRGSSQRAGRSSQGPKNPLPSLALRIRHSEKIVA